MWNKSLLVRWDLCWYRQHWLCLSMSPELHWKGLPNDDFLWRNSLSQRWNLFSDKFVFVQHDKLLLFKWIFHLIFDFVSDYGARCDCLPSTRGDFCQYSIATKSIASIVPAESRPVETQTLEDISGMGSSSANVHPNLQRANSISVAVGNRSQFVFCLTNPCENGGTCFVTNAATTKVDDLTTHQSVTKFVLILFIGYLCLSKRVCWRLLWKCVQ